MRRFRKLLVGLLVGAMVMGLAVSGVAQVRAADGVEINETNFPDETFRKFLLKMEIYDDGSNIGSGPNGSSETMKVGEDGVLTNDELSKIKSLHISYFDYIDDHHPYADTNNLKGIEYFTALESLTIASSKELKTLDLSHNTKLKFLKFGNRGGLSDNGCGLVSLDLSGNPELETLDMNSDFPNLTSVNVSKCTKLKSIYVASDNLENLDVSNNTELTKLIVGSKKIKTLDVSNCSKLLSLGVYAGDPWYKITDALGALESLDVSGCTSLQSLSVINDNIKSLDVSALTSLTSLGIRSKNISSIDLSNNKELSTLTIYNTNISSIDISACPKLDCVYIYGTKLSQFDISSNPVLLRIYNNYDKDYYAKTSSYQDIPVDFYDYNIPEDDDYQYSDKPRIVLDKGVTVITEKSEETKESEEAKESNNPATTYSNEWIDGKWYDEDGSQIYEGTLQWYSNSTGWWVEDTSGWYPQDCWEKIDGEWYYFKSDGYMASNEYYNGYWFNGDGSWNERYFLTWKCNSTGWWVEDRSGWWPSSSWLKINGSWYYFDSFGYMATNQYIDGYWLGSDGVCY